MNNKKNALVIFSDDSLGGTSRSALLMGSAWKQLGFQVSFSPQKGIHPSRVSEFNLVGNIVNPKPILGQQTYDVIHFHHGAWTSEQAEVARVLIAEASLLQTPPLLITHNVFGVPDNVLELWPGPKVVGVLSTWSAYQYRYSGGKAADEALAVVPNPQDTDFFRPPTAHERAAARKRIGVKVGDHVILRVGSPHNVKWHSAYKRLTPLPPATVLVLLGAPGSLRESMVEAQSVVFIDQVGENRELRDFYWAADVFAHAAYRGESFGNVILEAVACGLPVEYLARPYRDNAPWEFSELISAVNYRSTVTEWIRGIASTTRPVAYDQGQGWALAHKFYSVEATGRVLAAITEQSRPDYPRLRRLRKVERLQVLVRHNRLATELKRLRLWWRSQRG